MNELSKTRRGSLLTRTPFPALASSKGSTSSSTGDSNSFRALSDSFASMITHVNDMHSSICNELEAVATDAAQTKDRLKELRSDMELKFTTLHKDLQAAQATTASKFDDMTASMNAMSTSLGSKLDALINAAPPPAQAPAAPPPIPPTISHQLPDPDSSFFNVNHSSREANLIIRNLAEEENETESDLRELILDLTTQVCTPQGMLHISNEERARIMNKAIVEVRRLGTFTGKPRLTRVIFRNKQQLTAVRTQARYLPGSFYDGISFDNDITVEQRNARQAQQLAIKEAKDKGIRWRWSMSDPTRLELLPPRPRPETDGDRLAPEARLPQTPGDNMHINSP